MSLFSDLSIWTMVHGIALGGGAMMALFGSLVLTYARGSAATRDAATETLPRLAAMLSVVASALLWVTVLVGTYIVFPPYRATPPEGTTDPSAYPRSMLLADPSTAWLHSFGMEIKEHVPWIAAMLATAVAFVATRHADRLWSDASVRRTVRGWLAIALALVSAVALLGVFVNKVAPVQ